MIFFLSLKVTCFSSVDSSVDFMLIFFFFLTINVIFTGKTQVFNNE